MSDLDRQSSGIHAPEEPEESRELRTSKTMSMAAHDVLAERQRQIQSEGWTPEHDDEHSDGALARAAACYAVGVKFLEMPVENSKYNTGVWPFDSEWWKPRDTRRNLVRAAALIVAEIERIDRKAGRSPIAPESRDG